MGKLSFFQSSTRPSAVKVRDEGQEPQEAVRDTLGKITKRAVLERYPWPEGNYIYLKSIVSAGDQEKITEYTMHAVWKAKDDGSDEQEMQTEFALHRAAVATAAVMVVGFEGEAFEHPDTGEVPTMPPDDDMEGRLNVVRQLASAVVAFIDSEVNERNKNPLGLKRAENDTKSDSGAV